MAPTSTKRARRKRCRLCGHLVDVLDTFILSRSGKLVRNACDVCGSKLRTADAFDIPWEQLSFPVDRV